MQFPAHSQYWMSRELLLIVSIVCMASRASGFRIGKAAKHMITPREPFPSFVSGDSEIGICRMQGDPHFLTFNSRKFTFDGTGPYRLSDWSNSQGEKRHIDTCLFGSIAGGKIRSFAKSVTYLCKDTLMVVQRPNRCSSDKANIHYFSKSNGEYTLLASTGDFPDTCPRGEFAPESTFSCACPDEDFPITLKVAFRTSFNSIPNLLVEVMSTPSATINNGLCQSFSDDTDAFLGAGDECSGDENGVAYPNGNIVRTADFEGAECGPCSYRLGDGDGFYKNFDFANAENPCLESCELSEDVCSDVGDNSPSIPRTPDSQGNGGNQPSSDDQGSNTGNDDGNDSNNNDNDGNGGSVGGKSGSGSTTPGTSEDGSSDGGDDSTNSNENGNNASNQGSGSNSNNQDNGSNDGSGSDGAGSNTPTSSDDDPDQREEVQGPWASFERFVEDAWHEFIELFDWGL